jgi:pyrroloquinoline quinone biosynthesis protein B
MRVLVLGSSAGGGFPQWNCNCRNCRGVREGTLNAKPRTQSSIAVSADSESWVLINASPDILAQLKANPVLQPARRIRDTGIAGIILVDSQIDHTTGLFMLREGAPLQVYSTASVREDLTSGNPIFKVLASYCTVEWHQVRTGESFSVAGVERLSFVAIPVPSKAPPFSPHRERPRPDDNIGLLVRDAASGGTLFYAPGLAEIDEGIGSAMRLADCLMVDGTCWTDDEMIRMGAGHKRAIEMGHLAQSGANGMIAQLRRFPGPRKILIHINNTNPILDEDSAERAQLEREGIEVAYDGMEVTL